MYFWQNLFSIFTNWNTSFLDLHDCVMTLWPVHDSMASPCLTYVLLISTWLPMNLWPVYDCPMILWPPTLRAGHGSLMTFCAVHGSLMNFRPVHECPIILIAKWEIQHCFMALWSIHVNIITHWPICDWLMALRSLKILPYGPMNSAWMPHDPLTSYWLTYGSWNIL